MERPSVSKYSTDMLIQHFPQPLQVVDHDDGFHLKLNETMKMRTSQPSLSDQAEQV